MRLSSRIDSRPAEGSEKVGPGAGILPGLNPHGSGADSWSVSFTSGEFVVLGIVAAICVVAILRVAADEIRYATTLHDLKVRVNQLRIQRMELLKAYVPDEVGPADGKRGRVPSKS